MKILKTKSMCVFAMVGLVCCCQIVNATTFLPQDPRALAMGGVGVAAGNGAQAHFYNPSLLHNASVDENFNFEVAGTFRAKDKDQLIRGMKNFADDRLLTNFSNSLIHFTNDLNAFLSGLNQNLNTLESSRIRLSNDAQALRLGIHDVFNKVITLDVNAGAVVSVPNKQTLSWAMYYNAWSNAEAYGELDPNDEKIMQDVITLLDFSLTPIDLNDLNDRLNKLESLDAANSLQSTVNMSGIVFQEIGLSLATKYTSSGYDIDIGITPKYLYVMTGDYIRTLEELEEDRKPYKEEKQKTFSTFNFDVGISKQINEAFKTGIVVKNIIPQSFKMPNSEKKAKLQPAARFGVSYINKWFNIGADLDITENADTVNFNKSRFLAVGGEFDIWLLKLRAGYRANLSSSGGNVPSLGFGLYLFGLNIDAAVAATQLTIPKNIDDLLEYEDLSASLQIGVQF